MHRRRIYSFVGRAQNTPRLVVLEAALVLLLYLLGIFLEATTTEQYLFTALMSWQEFCASRFL